jgi:hypothetical protein
VLSRLQAREDYLKQGKKIADNRKQGKTMTDKGSQLRRREHLENADLDLDLDSSLDNSCSEVAYTSSFNFYL